MAYSRDGKESYKQFLGDWFKFIQIIKKEGLPYRDKNNPAIKPVLTRFPQDARSIQKCLNMGGACKFCDLFVTYVLVKATELQVNFLSGERPI